jgi:hypothetical protein
VVAEQAYDPAARLRRFFLEGYHKIHNFARLGPAIQEITVLDES